MKRRFFVARVMVVLAVVVGPDVAQAFPPSLAMKLRELRRGLAVAQSAAADRRHRECDCARGDDDAFGLRGVYTDDQARRGEAQYGRMCESCHRADLTGSDVDEIPALAWDAFLTRWNGRP